MTVLNVVQPDEFDPSGFEVVDGKLTPKISSHPDNILEITPDGLYAAGGSGGSVLERYRYDTSVDGAVIHKGIKFDFKLNDGAVSGYIYGVNPNDITPNDTIYYNGQVQGSMSDDAKLLLKLKWATENVQRSIITLFRNGSVPEIWSVQVILSSSDGDLIVIIDEMVNVGGLDSVDDDGHGPVMYQSDALLKFDNGLAVLAISPSGDLSIIKVNEDNTTDTTAYQLATEYGNTVNGFMEVSPALGVAVWKTRADKIVFTRFSETSSDIYTTVLGDSIYPASWIMIDKDSAGNHFVKEKQSNDGLELRVWCIAPDNTVTVYNHPNINIEGSNLVGSDILGDKLLVFGNTNDTSHIRVLDARTGTTLTQGNFAFHGNFNNLKLQRVDSETLLVVENIFATDDMPASIRVTLLKITATEVTVIKKSILALGTWGSLDGRSLTNSTYTDNGASISYQSAMREGKRYYVKIQATATDFKVYEQEVTDDIVTKAGALVGGPPALYPMITLFNEGVGYIQHDPKLSSFNTFVLDMVEHDNSPKPVAFTATWDRNNGHILLKGQIANTYTDNWTYFRLEVDTPSGETHSTKRRTGSAVNGVFTTSLWVIAEPGKYVFRVSHWDGGPVMEARATVPSDDGLDFTPPTVTPDGDGSWILSTTNAGAAGRGYKIYRSRDPISIIDEYYNGSRYITDVAENDPGRFTIPTSDRNGIWYIMVGQIGTGRIWTPTFFTYGG